MAKKKIEEVIKELDEEMGEIERRVRKLQLQSAKELLEKQNKKTQ